MARIPIDEFLVRVYDVTRAGRYTWSPSEPDHPDITKLVGRGFLEWCTGRFGVERLSGQLGITQEGLARARKAKFGITI
jgi:hypothetical protein